MKYILTLTVIALLTVTIWRVQPQEKGVVHLEAPDNPIRIKPVNKWTTPVPNIEHRDRCVLNNLECPEKYFSTVKNSLG